MKTKTAAVAIALLIASNIATGYFAFQRHRNIRADHLQIVRLNTQGEGTIYVTLGTSDTSGGPVIENPRAVATLSLTPRAAIQMKVELDEIIRSVQAAAAAREEQKSSVRVE